MPGEQGEAKERQIRPPADSEAKTFSQQKTRDAMGDLIRVSGKNKHNTRKRGDRT